MSYIINKTDGSILTEIVDGTIDQTATNLTLVGKNASAYGEFFNENFIHLLENFASSTIPSNPIAGQLWYDTSEGRLKVYDGNGFKVSGGTIVSNNVPTTIGQGDIWLDSYREQLYFDLGKGKRVLAGPAYTAQQGITGFSISDIVDTDEITRTIVLLYVGQVLIGIFSKSAFTPKSAIGGYTGSIEIGFNAGNFGGIKFNVTATKAENLVDSLGNLKTTDSFISTLDDSTMAGQLSIQNSSPLILGGSSQTEIKVTNTAFQIVSSVPQDFDIKSYNQLGQQSSLHITASSQRVGIYTDTPEATLDVNGDVVIQGDLSVKGATTIINTTNLEVADKLIELGKTDTPSNTTADGGGISLAGGIDGNKTIMFDAGNTSWSLSENLNLSSTRSYRINNQEVLSYTALGTSVTTAPGLTSIGALTSLQVSNLAIGGTTTESTIRFLNSVIANGSVTLVPKGNGTVDVSSSKITNVANPVNSTDAVNLQTLTSTIKSAPLGFALDSTGLLDTDIEDVLSIIFPVAEHENGTICRVHCLANGIRTPKEFRILSNAWSFSGNI